MGEVKRQKESLMRKKIIALAAAAALGTATMATGALALGHGGRRPHWRRGAFGGAQL